jgi:hypothetical protein
MYGSDYQLQREGNMPQAETYIHPTLGPLKLGGIHTNIDQIKATVPHLKKFKTTVPLVLPSGSYDTRKVVPVVGPNPMDGNDTEGDCVEAAKAKYQRIADTAATGSTPNITTAEVVAQYLKETGGQDVGLVPDLSFEDWKNNGALFGGEIRKILEHVQLDISNFTETMEAIYYLYAPALSIELPITAQDQVGKVWDVTPNADTDPNAKPGSWGDHETLAPAWLVISSDGSIQIVVETWSIDQPMTLAFFKKYVVLAEAFIDAKNATTDLIDPAAQEALLAQITQDGPTPPPTPTPPTPPTPPPAPPAPPTPVSWWQKIINWFKRIF